MRRSIKGVQIFSFIALFCTVVMWIALWASSAVPGSESGLHTDKVTNIVDNAFGISNKVNDKLTTYSIDIAIKNLKAKYYAGDTAQALVSYKPSATNDRDVIFTTSDSNIATIDESGLITFSAPGTVAIFAKLKSDTSISTYTHVRCYGEDPLDPEHPERLKFSYVNDLGELQSHKRGERRAIVFNDGKSELGLASISVEDENVVYYWKGYLYARNEGETKITYKFKDGEGEREIVDTIKVGYGEIPEIKLVGKNNKSYYHGNQPNKNDFLKIPSGQEAYYDCLVSSSNTSVAYLSGTDRICMNGIGSASLTYTSIYDPTKSTVVDVTVKLNPPTSISITGPDSLVCHESAEFTVKVGPIDYASQTKWEVVKGNGKIDGRGVLTATGYGRITIRCTSTIDESVYVEKEIKVKLFTSAYGFVRKAMGHAGLSAVLGFGLFGTMWLLLKRRIYIITVFPLTYFYAYISEFIQKFTPGRYASLNDVFIDFAGAVIGILVAIAVTELTYFIWRIVNKESYRRFRGALKVVNFRTLFYKTSTLVLAYENMHAHEPEDEIESEVTTDIVSEIPETSELIAETLADVAQSENESAVKDENEENESE